jgi:predicted DNA-binding transcriptional regulator AlpA
LTQAESKVAEFLTTKELSARWGGRITVRTLENWRSTSNGPPFIKLGGAVLYRVSDIDRWESSRTVNGTSQYRK